MGTLNRMVYQQFSFECSKQRVPIIDQDGNPVMQEVVVLTVLPLEIGPAGPMPLGVPLELWFQPDKWDEVHRQGSGSKLVVAKAAPPEPGVNGG